jgi:hypothetical protein
VGDQLLDPFLSLLHLATLLLGPIRLSIRPNRLGVGGILGLLGLALTRWESRPQGFFYTPSRWLAVVVTLAIAARFAYGWWRATHYGSTAPGGQHWLVTASGTQLSLAVAAGLIGYYLVYSIGVRLRLTRHQQRLSN